jgi:hypothetical protein
MANERAADYDTGGVFARDTGMRPADLILFIKAIDSFHGLKAGCGG